MDFSLFPNISVVWIRSVDTMTSCVLTIPEFHIGTGSSVFS